MTKYKKFASGKHNICGFQKFHLRTYRTKIYPHKSRHSISLLDELITNIESLSMLLEEVNLRKNIDIFNDGNVGSENEKL
jgi:hypothetical protein